MKFFQSVFGMAVSTATSTDLRTLDTLRFSFVYKIYESINGKADTYLITFYVHRS